jgi:hypothetical protein
MAARDTHTTTEELLKTMFPVAFVPRLYDEGQLPLEESRETALRGVGGWCEMAASQIVKCSE